CGARRWRACPPNGTSSPPTCLASAGPRGRSRWRARSRRGAGWSRGRPRRCTRAAWRRAGASPSPPPRHPAPPWAARGAPGTPVVPGRALPAALRRFRRLPAPLLPLFSDVTGRAEWLRMLDELERTDLRGYLPEVTAPALVVCGSRDWRAMPAACELAGGLPA